MAGFAYGPVKFDNGQDGAFAEIEVRDAASGGLASISDDNGVALTNPFNADEYGTYGFSANAGTYDITATLGNITTTAQKTIVDTAGGAVSGASFIIYLPSIEIGDIIDGTDLIETDLLYFEAQGSDSSNTSSFVVNIPEVYDQWTTYSSGTFTADANADHVIVVNGSFSMTNATHSFSGTVYLQKNGVSIETLADLSGSAGETDVQAVDTSFVESLSAGDTIRIFFSMVDGDGSESGSATINTFSATSRTGT